MSTGNAYVCFVAAEQGHNSESFISSVQRNTGLDSNSLTVCMSYWTLNVRPNNNNNNTNNNNK